MRDELRALVNLAEMDDAARGLEVELQGIPEAIEALRRDVRRLEELLARERAELASAQTLRQAQTQQIADRNESMSRAKARAAQARNTREAEAAERELETNRRLIREQEAEVTRLDEAIEAVRTRLEQHEKEFAELQQVVRREEQVAGQRREELEAERARVLGGREAVVAKLSSAVQRRYDRLRGRRSPAVVEVIDATCMGCRMQLPAQEFIELQRGESIHQCASCRRILYFRPLIEA